MPTGGDIPHQGEESVAGITLNGDFVPRRKGEQAPR
jgi:hypothetical protein